jgi:hypothetical protein
MVTEFEKAVLTWLASENTTRSGETLAFWVCFDIKKEDGDHPQDPADLAGCMRVLRAAPALRPHLHKLSGLSTAWERLVPHWDILEKTFLEDDSWAWHPIEGATRTYDLLDALVAGRYQPPAATR